MSEVKITYESLFALLRREKSREELQELDKTFFDDVINYLNEKSEMMDRQKGELSVFVDDEKERAEKQIYNIKRIIKELYERREKKIIEMALNKSRTKSNIIDTDTMLQEEKLMFDFLVSTIDRFRTGILINILEGKKASLGSEEEKEEKTGEEVETRTEEEREESQTKQLKFLHAVPKFVGKNLETYGPFEEGEQAELPSEIARVLLNKERAEEVTKDL